MTASAAPRIIGGRYVLDDDWREGGMARVYRAFDRLEHRTVAVKVLARELHPDERLVNLIFDREFRSLRRLSHRNIVALLDGGRDPETTEPYFVFEWVDRDLVRALDAEPSPTWDDFSGRFALPILDALAHAHEQQVSHRDIKPGNILVTDEGIPKIADFGIAKIEADIQPGLTLADHSTKPYVPPRGEPGPSRDVYAYAVLVLTALAGIDPLAAAGDVDERAWALVRVAGELRALRRYDDALPGTRPRLSAFVGRGRGARGLRVCDRDPLRRRRVELAVKLERSFAERGIDLRLSLACLRLYAELFEATGDERCRERRDFYRAFVGLIDPAAA